jgi:hypothetical protein
MFVMPARTKLYYFSFVMPKQRLYLCFPNLKNMIYNCACMHLRLIVSLFSLYHGLSRIVYLVQGANDVTFEQPLSL